MSLSKKTKLILLSSLSILKINNENKIIKIMFKLIARFPKIKLTGKKDNNRLEYS